MKHDIVKEGGLLFFRTHKDKVLLLTVSRCGEPDIVRSRNAANFVEALYDATQVTEGVSPGDEIWMDGKLVGVMNGAHLELA
jgi:hypothetical protein